MGLGPPSLWLGVVVYREEGTELIGAFESGNAPPPTDPPTATTIYMVGPGKGYHKYEGPGSLQGEWAALGSYTLDSGQNP